MEIKLAKEDIEAIAISVAEKIQSSPSKNKVYSAPDIAKILGCHKNTVYKYIDAKILKATKNGKGFLITQESLNNFLDEKV